MLAGIMSRQSIRDYLSRPVEPEKLALLFKAAMQAPSALNEQPWEFVIIDDRRHFERIMSVYPYAGMLRSAPLAILVCGDRRLEKAPGNWVLDCSCATQNLLLAAHGLGLGAVWSGIYPETDRMQALAELLHLPERVIPLALVALGYPAHPAQAPADRFRPDRLHYNNWQTAWPMPDEQGQQP